MTPKDTRYHLCWCKHSWPAETSNTCPLCGKEPIQSADRHFVDSALYEDTLDNGNVVATLDMNHIHENGNKVYGCGAIVGDLDFCLDELDRLIGNE